MSDEPLLTVRQVADELGLPESTVRYYRDAFLDHIPFVGMARRRRYPPAAVAVLRTIAQGYAEGRSHGQILAGLDGGAAPASSSATGTRARGADRHHGEVSNLELLAAIVDGEREQRDALWQMAGEIVRLTGVLEVQERSLVEIAGRAGLPDQAALERAGRVAGALGDGGSAPRADAVPAAPPPAPLAPPAAAEAAAVPLFGRTPLPLDEPPLAAPPGPAARAAAEADAAAGTALASELERLRTELESERQLVERLREAKVKLEHRVTGAEAELDERRHKGSVLGRILKSGDRP